MLFLYFTYEYKMEFGDNTTLAVYYNEVLVNDPRNLLD